MEIKIVFLLKFM
uniref:Uncharacterized protein n=1 Tax=Anguilla anguilla TaxID=7936 RepID=A0A0E9PRU1_ANGAN